MLITCPSCATAYELPAERIGASGRKVRCASCRESWFIASPGEKSEDEPPPSLEDFAVDEPIEIVARPVPLPSRAKEDIPVALASRRKSKARSPSRRFGEGSRLATLGRAATIAALCLAPPALLVGREKVVSTLPGTASLYRTIGLPVNLVGLSFDKVSSTLSREDATPVLEVAGSIVNDGRAARSVPWLEISLQGDGGEPLYSWSAKAVEGELGIGETAPFRVRLTAPPPDARKVAVTFRREAPRKNAGRSVTARRD